jgi:methoxymalonate biosynthesis acyl carrier protein
VNVRVEQATRPTPDTVGIEIGEFLSERLNTAVDTEQDLFASGLISSMFAMELVVHLEQSYGIAVVGRDLKLDNFRSVLRMTDLVLRLRDAPVTEDV